MTADAKTIFLQAIEIRAATDRESFIRDRCAHDEALLDEVRRLLGHYREVGSFLEAPAPEMGSEPTVDCADPVTTGGQIGPYKLREVIGEGGMGTVFAAQQEKPLRRKVALKVIKPGMDSEAVLARFEAERQALALMDHPSIAKVLDAGTTGQGRPYFVMELIQGQPITEYCDEKRLTVDERMKIFTHVCKAVQHAHQKGVIHRDIKPSNVLVTEIDGRPIPKVIDFGVAKALGSSLTENTVYTSFQALVGTPMYMSPEQAKLSGVDVDTRSDVYSLGVLLYELLTGELPFDRDRLKQAALDEVCRIIREEDPPSLGQRVSCLGETVTTVSQNRGTDRVRLIKSLKNEPNWIVCRAMEKNRNRRYETVDQLASDVDRYLQGDAVQACPPSVLYRWRKAAARNKDILVTTSAAITFLVAGLVFASWQWKQQSDLAASLTAAQGIAEEESSRRRRLLYIADMNSAAAAQAQGDVSRAVELIQRHEKDDELKGPEWYCLYGLCRDSAKVEKTIPLGYGARGLATSPTDGRLFAGLQNNGVAVVDPAEGVKLTFGVQNRTWIAGYLAFSHDGKFLITPNDDLRNAKVLSWPSRKPEFVLGPHEGNVCSVAISPDDRFVVAGDRSGAISVWDMATGDLLHRRQILGDDSGPDAFVFVAFSSDYRLASGGSSSIVQLWRVTKDDLVVEMEYDKVKGGVSAFAFSKDASILAIGSQEQIDLLDLHTEKTIARLYGHDSSIRTLEFSDDATQLLSASRDKTIKLWDIPSQSEILTKMVHSSVATGAMFLEDDLIISIGFDGNMCIWKAEPPTWRKRFVTGVEVGDAQFSPDSKRLLMLDVDRVVSLDPEESKSKEFPLSLQGAVFAQSDSGLVAVGGDDGDLELRTLVDWKGSRRKLGKHRERVTGIDISSDGSVVATIGKEGEVKVWDAESGRETLSLTLPRSNVRSWQERILSLSPTADSVACAQRDGKICVYHFRTGEQITLATHTRTVFDVDYSPDGRWLATCDWSGLVCLWDLSLPIRSQPAAEFQHPLWTRTNCFSADSKTLIVSCGDSTLRFWDIETGQQKCALKISSYRDMEISPDGKSLAGVVSSTVRDRRYVELLQIGPQRSD